MDTEKREFQILEIEETAQPSAFFELDGKPFCFVGTNNYYLNFKSEKMVEDVFAQARKMGLKVMRFWGYLDIGSLDGTVPHVDGDGPKEGVYMQYWDTKAQKPAYHEGKDGMRRLDLVLTLARKYDVKVIFVLTNNWKEFGGMDQYLTWYGLEKHHEFYTDERVKQAYKDWVAHVVNRVNTIDGVPYKEDPGIFAWELANEPRCKNHTDFDSNEGWDKTTVTQWADEMSAYIKSLDENHMVAVGDEGFIDGGRDHWTYKAHHGVDHEALSSLPNIDFATFHLYPDNWGTGYRFGYDWIRDHIEIAQRIGKPTILEEYGTIVRRDDDFKITWGWERRKTAYTNWNNLMLKRGGNGSLFWILVGYDDYQESGLYPDYDHYSVYNPGPTAELLSDFANQFSTNARACTLTQVPPSAEPSKFVRARPGSSRPEAALDVPKPPRG